MVQMMTRFKNLVLTTYWLILYNSSYQSYQQVFIEFLASADTTKFH